MTIRLIITAGVLAASASAVFAQRGHEERAVPAAISMTCTVGNGSGEFDVLFDRDKRTLSFLPGERLQSAEHRFAHGLLIIHARQDDVEYSARIAERPFVTIRESDRLNIYPCFDVKTSAGSTSAVQGNSGLRG